MTGQGRFIDVGSQQIHYMEWGSGKQLLLAFHGYGDSAAMFEPLHQYLDNAYTVLSFDLPHHGKSAWPAEVLLSEQHIAELVEKLKDTYNVSKVSLLGFSMGGRICLAVVAAMPKSINKLVLAAADGLTVNFYFYLFTQTYFGKKIFRNMLAKPRPYFLILDWLKKRKLVHNSRHKFVMHYLQSAESRAFLLRVWHGMSGIMPSVIKVRRAIKWYSIPVTIFMGAYDKIMPPALAKDFVRGLDTANLIVLEKGHRVFDNETARQIAEPFL